ncbi:MAG: protease modulator HflC, partial [Sphingobium sp.]
MPAAFRNPVIASLIALAVLILFASTFSIVPETRQAVVVRFGEPVAILNAYKQNETFGKTGAGLYARVPFADQIVWIDKRIQSVEMDRQQV